MLKAVYRFTEQCNTVDGTPTFDRWTGRYIWYREFRPKPVDTLVIPFLAVQNVTVHTVVIVSI